MSGSIVSHSHSDIPLLPYNSTNNTASQSRQRSTAPVYEGSFGHPFNWKTDSLVWWCICHILGRHTPDDLKWFLNGDGGTTPGQELHDRYLQRIQQISVVQGLVLATAAVFITTNPPSREVQDIDYTSPASYACLAESLVFSLFGILFQLQLYTSGSIFQEHGAATIAERWKILWYLLSLVIPVIVFVISVVLLLMAIVLTAFTSHNKTVQFVLA
ncbi:hypothetical protein BDR07DRAFT_1461901 [Suillus spraguei]|nr:hypothetical protein BDR07DRAFT_1461901 [Suillus spraguei]